MVVTIKDYETVLNEMLTYLAVQLEGEITDFNPGSVVRTFAEAISYQIGVNSNIPNSLYQELEDVYNAAFISTSSGDDLDNLVELVGVTRTPAVKSAGVVTFFAQPAPTSNIVIPAGTQVSTQPSESGARIVFITTAESTLLLATTSVDVAIEAQTAGLEGNVDANKVTYLVDSIFGITSLNNALAVSGGSNQETDDALRLRAKGAVEVSGNATSEALRLSVLGVAGVGSVTVFDLPERTQDDEVHEYATGTDDYTLYHWGVKDDVYMNVTGTAGAVPYTFIKNTDYIVDVLTNQIQFGQGGTDPDNATNVLADYNYASLGEVDMIVAGISIPMAPSTLTEVEDVVAEVKAAGVKVTVIEPSVLNQDVTCLIVVINGFTPGDVQTAVDIALTNYLNTMDVGYDVYLADLYQVIQGVSGVLNSTISVPGTDVVIAETEVARAGTITVNV